MRAARQHGAGLPPGDPGINLREKKYVAINAILRNAIRRDGIRRENKGRDFPPEIRLGAQVESILKEMDESHGSMSARKRFRARVDTVEPRFFACRFMRSSSFGDTRIPKVARRGNLTGGRPNFGFVLM